MVVRSQLRPATSDPFPTLEWACHDREEQTEASRQRGCSPALCKSGYYMLYPRANKIVLSPPSSMTPRLATPVSLHLNIPPVSELPRAQSVAARTG